LLKLNQLGMIEYQVWHAIYSVVHEKEG